MKQTNTPHHRVLTVHASSADEAWARIHRRGDLDGVEVTLETNLCGEHVKTLKYQSGTSFGGRKEQLK